MTTSLRQTVRVYGSLLVLVIGFLCGGLTIALFISASWVVETLGLVGFVLYVLTTFLCALLSFMFDLIGNAKEAFA
ncbi:MULTISPECIES: hypothetical protein [Halobacterium]|uniref:Vng6330h n=4 Tax=Halobacterium salinarum TaxID=2242 RepID=Q9HHL9_HALSA|nr:MULTISPECIES: hypothetical protein [Halobacterium]AAG20959.1 Vng6330h [Halobacterium salinarum NRC-1]MBB6090527.1 putative membrane channel-forming protein YqfA (hemolysin III family) [Halobacterium salinarum]MCF2166298.1 hypothetical protein [Halobacterium salinarum]MCF2168117.1 hypothetical protein [Halobacterium salinarum]MCF2207924.1 hypothetical protein [Halobacterium salinarum]